MTHSQLPDFQIHVTNLKMRELFGVSVTIAAQIFIQPFLMVVNAKRNAEFNFDRVTQCSIRSERSI